MTESDLTPWTVITSAHQPVMRWTVLNRDVDNPDVVWLIVQHVGVPVQVPRRWVLENCEVVGRIKTAEDMRRWNNAN